MSDPQSNEMSDSTMFPRDEETDSLLRNATAHASADDWDSALDCLAQARNRLVISPVDYPIETWCKYPLYLSRAGRFEESMREFDWLLADLPRRARKQSFLDMPNISTGSTSKKSIYSAVMKNGKRTIEQKRQVALRRMAKATLLL